MQKYSPKRTRPFRYVNDIALKIKGHLGLGTRNVKKHLGIVQVYEQIRAEGHEIKPDRFTLIENAIDDQGNTITRALDDQNNVIETKFDSAGNEISKVGMNVDTMLTNAQTYKNDLSSQITTSSNDAMSQISTGFQAGNTEQMKQTRDLANVASGMSDLDINMRQDFNQIGKAFDNSGQLIQNSIEENGNTISRAVDKNGMLLLRRFDVTGNSLGDKVINLSRAYTNLNSISMPGSNSSMGNLTAARTGEVANSGFMSPYQST